MSISGALVGRVVVPIIADDDDDDEVALGVAAAAIAPRLFERFRLPLLVLLPFCCCLAMW
jgi:hypothetical protein